MIQLATRTIENSSAIETKWEQTEVLDKWVQVFQCSYFCYAVMLSNHFTVMKSRWPVKFQTWIDIEIVYSPKSLNNWVYYFPQAQQYSNDFHCIPNIISAYMLNSTLELILKLYIHPNL